MGKCSICMSENQEKINKLLRKRVPFQEIRRSYSVSVGTLWRHRKHALAASESPAPPDSKAVRSWRRILRRALATSDLASATRAQSAIDNLQRASPEANTERVEQTVQKNRDPERLVKALREIYGLKAEKWSPPEIDDDRSGEEADAGANERESADERDMENPDVDEPE